MRKTVWLTITATIATSILAFGVLMVSTASRAAATDQHRPAAQPAAPGTITVLGYGDAAAPADVVHVQLNTGGSPGFYGPDGPAFEPVEEENLTLIAEVLEKSEIPADLITTNAFGRSTYGPTTIAGEVRFVHSEPAQLSGFLTDLMDAIKKARGPKIQSATTVFLVEDCLALESEAMQTALDDARLRAEMMADQMDVTLGQLVTVEEGSPGTSNYGSSGGGNCAGIEAAIHQTGFTGTNIGVNTAAEVEVSITLKATFEIE